MNLTIASVKLNSFDNPDGIVILSVMVGMNSGIQTATQFQIAFKGWSNSWTTQSFDTAAKAKNAFNQHKTTLMIGGWDD